MLLLEQNGHACGAVAMGVSLLRFSVGVLQGGSVSAPYRVDSLLRFDLWLPFLHLPWVCRPQGNAAPSARLRRHRPLPLVFTLLLRWGFRGCAGGLPRQDRRAWTAPNRHLRDFLPFRPWKARSASSGPVCPGSGPGSRSSCSLCRVQVPWLSGGVPVLGACGTPTASRSAIPRKHPPIPGPRLPIPAIRLPPETARTCRCRRSCPPIRLGRPAGHPEGP